MGISVQIAKKLENGFVQVDTSTTGYNVIRYKVPEQSADSFCKEYKNNHDNRRKNKNLIDFALTPVCIFTSYLLLNKTKIGDSFKFISCTAIGLAIDHIINLVNNNSYILRKENIVKKYNAKELSENGNEKEDAFNKVLK